MQSIKEIREQFPILGTTVNGKPLVYLDNAASAQRPQSVTGKWLSLVEEANANIHRGLHRLSNEATREYEDTREAVRAFINAESAREIIFTSGATASVNLVAFSFGEAFVREGDEVIVSVAEHHSNIVPWQMMCSRRKASLKVLDIDKNGLLQPEALEKLISQKTKIIAISQCSNVLGLKNDIKSLVQTAHKKGVPVLVDGAQGIVHSAVDVRDLDCDFYVFSGHKMYAATGTGVLYGKLKWLQEMPPYMGGGEMIQGVSFENTVYAQSPAKFEAGTQNFNSVPTLVPAIEFLRSTRESALVEREQESILEFMLEQLRSDCRIRLYGDTGRREDKIPLFSIAVDGAHHEDLALILDKMGIATRSGQMCAEPLMDRLGVTGLLRISFAPYNTLEEAEYFIKSLRRAIEMLI